MKQRNLANTKHLNCMHSNIKIYFIFVEVEVVILLCPPGIQGLSLETLNFLSLGDRKLHFLNFLSEENTTIKQRTRQSSILLVLTQEKEKSLLSWQPV